MMAAQTLTTSDISLPVLQKTTSNRVNATQSDSQDINLDCDTLPAPPPELLNYDSLDDSIQNLSDIDSTLPPPPPPLQQLQSLQHPHRQPPPPPPILQEQERQPSQSSPPPQHPRPVVEPETSHYQQQLPEKSDIILQQIQQEEATRRLQSKYASPENILPTIQPNTSNTDTKIPENHIENSLPNALTTHLTLADNVDSVINHVKKSHGTGSVSAFSDASSDISDATTSAPSATSSGSAPPTTVPIHQGATETDIQQVDMFYRSHKTDVRVCQSLANMYLSAAKTLERMPAGQGGSSNGEIPLQTPNPTEMSMDDWDFIKTGIPVLVLNTGEHLRTRKLTIVLAEKGTGFSLWEDELNSRTRYETPHSNFHTLSLSTDPSRLVGFSFDEANAASEFSEALTSLLPTPDEGLADKKKKKKKKEKKPKQKYKAPRKIDISQPCCFVHVTKLERNVLGLPPSSLFPPPPSGAELSQEMLRSRSQSSELSEYSTSPSEN